MPVDSRAVPLATDEQCATIYKMVSNLRKQKRVKIGVNEVIKTLNHGEAQLVVMSGDTSPFEIIQGLKSLCDDKNVKFIFVRSRDALGQACNVNRASACVVYYMNDNDYKVNKNAIAKAGL